MPAHRPSRRPDMLAVLTLVAGIGIFTSAVAEAEDGLFGGVDLFYQPSIDALLDGDVRVAGNERGGLHLSVESESVATTPLSDVSQPSRTFNSGVHFSFRVSF